MRAWYQGPAWKARRREAIEQAGGTCQICGTDAALEVHHVKEYRTETEFLRGPFWVVCRDCHRGLHSTGRDRRKAWRAEAMRA